MSIVGVVLVLLSFHVKIFPDSLNDSSRFNDTSAVRLRLFFLVDDSTRQDTVKFSYFSSENIKDSFLVILDTDSVKKDFLIKVEIGIKPGPIKDGKVKLEYEFAKGLVLEHEFVPGKIYNGLFNIKSLGRDSEIVKLGEKFLFIDFSASMVGTDSAEILSSIDKINGIINGIINPDSNIYYFYTFFKDTTRKDTCIIVRKGDSSLSSNFKNKVTLFNSFFSQFQKKIQSNNFLNRNSSKKLKFMYILTDGLQDTTSDPEPTGCTNSLNQFVLKTVDSIIDLVSNKGFFIQIVPLIIKLPQSNKQKECLKSLWTPIFEKCNFVLYDILKFNYASIEESYTVGEKQEGEKGIVTFKKNVDKARKIVSYIQSTSFQDIMLISQVSLKSLTIYYPRKYKNEVKSFAVDFSKSPAEIKKELKKIEVLENKWQVEDRVNLMKELKPIFGNLFTFRNFKCYIKFRKDPKGYYYITRGYLFNKKTSSVNFLTPVVVKDQKYYHGIEIPYQKFSGLSEVDGRLILVSSNPPNPENTVLVVKVFKMRIYGKSFRSLIFFLYDLVYLSMIYFGIYLLIVSSGLPSSLKDFYLSSGLVMIFFAVLFDMSNNGEIYSFVFLTLSIVLLFKYYLVGRL